MVPELDLAIRESRAARRLGRLFRLERAGAFARWPAETVWRLIARRGTLVAELSELERQRAGAAASPLPELEAALGELAREVELSRERAEALVAELGAELRARRSAGVATGLRDDGGQSRLLGHG